MSQWLWFVSIASGVASLVLLTTVLVLGVVSTTSQRPRRTAVANGVHRSLALGMTVFLAAHIVTAIVDGYVNLTWISVLLPFTSGYETAWIGLGTLALDILIAVIVTSLLRHRLPERAWRTIHQSTWGLWILALVHGFMLGSTGWLQAFTIVCGITGIGAGVLWAAQSTRDATRRDVVAAEVWQ